MPFCSTPRLYICPSTFTYKSPTSPASYPPHHDHHHFCTHTCPHITCPPTDPSLNPPHPTAHPPPGTPLHPDGSRCTRRPLLVAGLTTPQPTRHPGQPRVSLKGLSLTPCSPSCSMSLSIPHPSPCLLLMCCTSLHPIPPISLLSIVGVEHSKKKKKPRVVQDSLPYTRCRDPGECVQHQGIELGWMARANSTSSDPLAVGA